MLQQQQHYTCDNNGYTCHCVSTGEHSATGIKFLLKLMQLDYSTNIHAFAGIISVL
jgi:hypothetical protein